jgi:hypothetical protein
MGISYLSQGKKIKEKLNMKKKFLAISLILGFAVFIGIAVLTKLFTSGDLPVQISGALLEAVVTALITYFLLTGQTTQEEIKERQVKIFEKKQEVYHSFLEELKRIIQDGEITISIQGKKANLDKNVDELKDLMFQLGYLQMHTEEKKADDIFEGVAKIIQLMNDFNSEKENKQALLPEFYASIADELFKIISILKSDLYGKEIRPFDKQRFQAILQECDLFIENQEFNKHDIQKYFWDELREQLRKKGYVINPYDFTKDISEYYARARNRHRYYGFSFEITKKKSGSPVLFRVEIDNNIYYGFYRESVNSTDELISKCISATSKNFAATSYWYGWKYSDRYPLDFWRMQGFEHMKNDKTKTQFIKGLADEIDMYIKIFLSKSKEMGL